VVGGGGWDATAITGGAGGVTTIWRAAFEDDVVACRVTMSLMKSYPYFLTLRAQGKSRRWI
jgi:hypothetical protein